jgi:hypothetical protein
MATFQGFPQVEVTVGPPPWLTFVLRKSAEDGASTYVAAFAAELAAPFPRQWAVDELHSIENKADIFGHPALDSESHRSKVTLVL